MEGPHKNDMGHALYIHACSLRVQDSVNSSEILYYSICIVSTCLGGKRELSSQANSGVSRQLVGDSSLNIRRGTFTCTPSFTASLFESAQPAVLNIPIMKYSVKHFDCKAASLQQRYGFTIAHTYTASLTVTSDAWTSTQQDHTTPGRVTEVSHGSIDGSTECNRQNSVLPVTGRR